MKRGVSLRKEGEREKVKFPDGEAGNAGKGLPASCCLAGIGGKQNTIFGRVDREED